MKKFLSIALCLFALCVMFAACNGCGKQVEPTQPNENPPKENVAETNGNLVFENVVSTDRQSIFAQTQGKDVEVFWYEAEALLDKALDEVDSPEEVKLVQVMTTFQLFSEKEGYNVIQKVTQADGKSYESITPGVWIEDFALNDEPIKLTFVQAYQQLFKANAEANIVKPHSRKCYLRKPIGPKDCNPQYVFGTISQPIFVDAVDGKVRSYNPAFNPDELNKPLGEWP